MEKLDRLVWTAGMSFIAYGTHLGIRVNDPAVLERFPNHLPPSWEPSSEPEVEVLYSLLVGGNESGQGIRRYHLAYADTSRLVRTLDLAEALDQLESHMQWVVAVNSTENLFVHAGVVGWQGQAIVIPGDSFSGKTTLVAALLKAGATYYSDEFAVFDRQGQVWPYPRLLSVRKQEGQNRHRCPPEELGADVGQAPLPVGLVVVTEYQPGARWQARLLSPGQALLALLNHTVAARSQPEHALTTLQRVVMQTKTIKSKRGEADQVTPALLRQLKGSVL
jgi:hypothetical protein